MVYSVYAIVVLVWGLTWYAIKLQVGSVPVEVSIFYRQFLGGIILLGWCVSRKIELKFTLKQHIMALFLGLFMFSAHLLFVYQSSIFLYSGMVALVFSLVGVCNIFYNRLFLKISPQPKVVIGSILGIIGVTTFFSREIFLTTLEDATLTGIILAFIGMMIFSFGNFMSKVCQSYGMKVIPTTVMAVVYASLIILAYSLIKGVEFVFPKDVIYWSSILYLAIFGTAVGFVSYIWLIREIGSDKAGYATVMFPPIALLLSSIAEGYQWQLTDFIGLCIALFGNVLVLGTSRHFIRKPSLG